MVAALTSEAARRGSFHAAIQFLKKPGMLLNLQCWKIPKGTPHEIKNKKPTPNFLKFFFGKKVSYCQKSVELAKHFFRPKNNFESEGGTLSPNIKLSEKSRSAEKPYLFSTINEKTLISSTGTKMIKGSSLGLHEGFSSQKISI